jgi:hypothetical protein
MFAPRVTYVAVCCVLGMSVRTAGKKFCHFQEFKLKPGVQFSMKKSTKLLFTDEIYLKFVGFFLLEINADLLCIYSGFCKRKHTKFGKGFGIT